MSDRVECLISREFSRRERVVEQGSGTERLGEKKRTLTAGWACQNDERKRERESLSLRRGGSRRAGLAILLSARLSRNTAVFRSG